MTARGNKWETRWPGFMSSVADGSTYSAPVVETGSCFHSSRIANATSPTVAGAKVRGHHQIPVIRRSGGGYMRATPAMAY